MSFSYRNSVSSRLILAFSGVILVFGIAVTLSIRHLATFNDAVERITGPMLAQIETVDAWSANVSESMRHARNMLIMDDKGDIQGQLDKITELDAADDEYARRLKPALQSERGRELLKRALAAREALAPLNRDFTRQATSGDIKAAKVTLLATTRTGRARSKSRVRSVPPTFT